MTIRALFSDCSITAASYNEHVNISPPTCTISAGLPPHSWANLPIGRTPPPEQRKIASRQAGENHGARKPQRLRNLAEQQITEIVAIERAEENQRRFLRMTSRDVHGSGSAQFDRGNNCATLAMARRILFQCEPRQYTRWHPSQHQNSSNTAPVRGGSRPITASFATPRSGRLHSRQRPDAGREKSSE